MIKSRILQLSAVLCFVVLTLGLASAFLNQSSIAQADSNETICYELDATHHPFATEDEEEHEGVNTSTKVKWCYQKVSDPDPGTLIYQPDENGHFIPEMAILKKLDGTLVHASRKAGELSFHRMYANGFNPIGAPLSPPKNAVRVLETMTPSASDSLQNGIRLFQEYGDIVVRADKINTGTFSAYVPEELTPWRGYWFPYSSRRMHHGEDSVLAKYDQFISRRTAATNPGAQKWEKRMHSRGFGWSGHCNGWAAASVLSREPKAPITDPFSGVTFGISDLKGLLIERHYCPKIVFYGSRNYGKPTDDPNDIYASTFHNVLTYFIGELKKPVLIDLMATRPVQNNAISGYTMKIKKTGANTYYVDAKVKVHLYDNQHTEETGEARSVIKNYRYTLRTSSAGYVTSGTWHSANPDFLWVPLAPGNCDFKNHVVEQLWVDEIFRFAN